MINGSIERKVTSSFDIWKRISYWTEVLNLFNALIYADKGNWPALHNVRDDNVRIYLRYFLDNSDIRQIDKYSKYGYQINDDESYMGRICLEYQIKMYNKEHSLPMEDCYVLGYDFTVGLQIVEYINGKWWDMIHNTDVSGFVSHWYHIVPALYKSNNPDSSCMAFAKTLLSLYSILIKCRKK